MTIYTGFLVALLLISLGSSDKTDDVFFEIVILTPIFGRIFGWW